MLDTEKKREEIKEKVYEMQAYVDVYETIVGWLDCYQDDNSCHRGYRKGYNKVLALLEKELNK